MVHSIGRKWRAPFSTGVLVAGALLAAPAQQANGDCALIPAAIRMLPSEDGAVDRPFAAPGDTVTVYSDSPCKPATDQPHFDVVAANNQVTLIFQPPTGATPPPVAPITASAVLKCGSGRCFALEFQVPDTTGLAGAFPLTGPARIEVRNLAAGGALVAVIGELFEPKRGCNSLNGTRNLFQRFSVLPPRNVYDATASTTLQATVDGSGALLIPLDYSLVLASPLGSGSGTVRLLSIDADLPNGLSAPNKLLLPPDGDFIRPPRFGGFVRSFSLNGRPIPPLLKVSASKLLSANGVVYGDSIVGSVDFVDSVLRIAKVGPNPSNPAASLQIFALNGEQGQPGLTLQAGVGPVLLTGVSFAAGAAAPLNSVSASNDLAVVARDEKLEQAFGAGNQNGDGDFDDRVVHFVDLGSNAGVTTGMAVQESDGKANLASHGSRVAFLQSEIHQDGTDFTGDVDVLDGIFRVWTSGGSHPFCGGSACELTAGLPAYAADPRAAIQGSGLPAAVAFSGIADPSRYVFFARSEPGEAPYAAQRLSVTSVGGQTTLASHNPSVSLSGRYVAFTSADTAIVSGGTVPGVRQIYVRDIFSGTNTLMSPRSGAQTAPRGGNDSSDNASVAVDFSSGILFVAFDSLATNLIAGDTEGKQDVFLSYGSGSVLSRLSAGGNGASSRPHLADDDTVVVYESLATNLVAGDTNGASDIFRVATGFINERVSLTNSGGQADGASTDASVSGDGNLVVFQSTATNLVAAADANGVSDIYLRDRTAGTTERISLGYAGAEANGASVEPDLSYDGRYVVFASNASNLLPPGVTLIHPLQCYVRDRVKQTTVLVSATLGGEGANAKCQNPSIDPTGRFVTFASDATNLDPLASTESTRIYYRDLGTGTVVAASANMSTGVPTAGPTGTRSEIGVSQQGILVYDTSASDLGPVDTNGTRDVYGAMVQSSPSFNTSGPVPDGDNFDSVLFVFDTVNRSYTNTQLPVAGANPYGDVAVAGGRAAVAPAGTSPLPGYIWDQEAGGVLRAMGGGAVYPFRVAISETTFCAVDLGSGTLHVGDPTTGATQNTFISVVASADTQVKAVGNRCVVIGSDGRLSFATRTGGSHTRTFTGIRARDFQVGEEGIAFRSCEADASADLNLDGDLDDCVMRFWDFDAVPNLIDTQHVAVPCTFPGCEPFFEPYRVGPGFVSFVTSEPKEADFFGLGGVGVTCLRTSPDAVCDKTGDEDGDDVAIEIFNLASGRSQVFPVNPDNPPRVDPFPKVVSGGADNVFTIQLPAELLGTEYGGLPPDQLVTLIVGDPDGDAVFEVDGNTDPRTSVADKCQELADPGQVDLDGDGLGAGCDILRFNGQANDDPAASPAPALLPGAHLCDLNRSGTITRAEVDQIWDDRETPISQPVDHLAPLDGLLDATDDRDRDADGEISAVDFRLCLADCSAQGNGCPLTEAPDAPRSGYGGSCGLGIELLVVLLPWAWRRRTIRRRQENG